MEERKTRKVVTQKEELRGLVLRALVRQEVKRKAKVLREKFGVAELPPELEQMAVEGKDFVVARLAASGEESAVIYGPFRDTLEDALADFRHLEKALRQGGEKAARKEAAKLDAEAMTKRHRRR